MVDSAELERVFKYAEFLAEQKLRRVLDQGDIANQLANFYFDSNYRPMMLVALISGLLLESEQNATAWDILSRIASRFIADAEPLPDDLRRWTVQLLAGKSTRPAKTSGRPSQIGRDSSVVLAIKYVLEGCPDLKATRSGAHGEQPNAAGRSACDAVGLAMQRLKKIEPNLKLEVLSYSSIRGIWQRHVKDREPD